MGKDNECSCEGGSGDMSIEIESALKWLTDTHGSSYEFKYDESINIEMPHVHLIVEKKILYLKEKKIVKFKIQKN